MKEQSSLCTKVREGRLSVGSWLTSGYPLTCEMMARAGFEWLVIDMEHTSIGTWSAQQLIQVADLAGCPPLVRVGANDPLAIKRAMDAGAHGVLVPMINTPDEAKRAVEALYYPPRGTRGCGLARAQGYGVAFEAYRQWASENVLLIVQIEHHQAVGNLTDIVAVDGVDGFIVGPYDLSGSLGIPGQFDHPLMREQISKINRVIRSTSKAAGYHVVHSNPKELRKRIDEGYRFIAYGDDMVFLAEKLQAEYDSICEVVLGD